METNGLLRWIWGPWSRLALWTAAIAFVLDQINKLWMIKVYDIQNRGTVHVLPFMDLKFLCNEGVSFSFMSGTLRPGVLAAFAVIASLALAAWIAQAGTGALMSSSVGLIIGGAIGNGIDRLWLGCVADFYSLHAFGYSWYVFNIADVAIVAGVIGLLYDSFMPSRDDAANAP